VGDDVVLRQVTSAIRTRQTNAPKTVLGFVGIVIVAVIAGGVSAAGVLSQTSSAWLAPWVLGFAGVFAVAFVIAVLAIAIKDPSKLMLTHVSGTEYAAIQQQTTLLGDSSAGERLTPIGIVIEDAALPSAGYPGAPEVAALPPAGGDEPSGAGGEGEGQAS
jgi:hypothetical protein